MKFEWKDVDVSHAFPEIYDATNTIAGEITGTRGGDKTCTALDAKTKLSEIELGILGKFFLTASLNSRNLSVDQVIFTPADTFEHINTVGKPFYVLESITPNGEYKYEFETHFKLK